MGGAGGAAAGGGAAAPLLRGGRAARGKGAARLLTGGSVAFGGWPRGGPQWGRPASWRGRVGGWGTTACKGVARTAGVGDIRAAPYAARQRQPRTVSASASPPRPLRVRLPPTSSLATATSPRLPQSIRRHLPAPASPTSRGPGRTSSRRVPLPATTPDSSRPARPRASASAGRGPTPPKATNASQQTIRATASSRLAPARHAPAAAPAPPPARRSSIAPAAPLSPTRDRTCPLAAYPPTPPGGRVAPRPAAAAHLQVAATPPHQQKHRRSNPSSSPHQQPHCPSQQLASPNAREPRRPAARSPTTDAKASHCPRHEPHATQLPPRPHQQEQPSPCPPRYLPKTPTPPTPPPARAR